MEDRYEAVKLKDRYLAYLIDIVIILSISSIIASALGAEPVLSKICMYYLYGKHKIFQELISHSGLIFILSYVSISISYFFYESYAGISVGKVVFRMNTGIIKGENKILRCFIRSLIKIFPIVAFIDALFAFKKRLKQTLSERKLGFVVVREKDTKVSALNYFIFGLIIYYVPLLTAIIIEYFFPWGQIIAPPSPGSMRNTKPLPGQILPHIFIETLGYITGIMSGAYIATMLISLVEGYFERKEVSYIGNTILWYLKRIIAFALISITLLVIAAYVETYITSYILSHYY